MKPEDLTPEQMVRVLALGSIVLGLFFGAMIAWIVFVVRQQRGKRFSIAQAPLATFGAIDVVTGIAFLFFMVFGLQLAWVSINGPRPADVSPTTDATIHSHSDSDVASTESDVAPTESDKQPAWGKLTQEKLLFSGVVSTMQLVAVVFLFVFVRIRSNASAKEMGWTPYRFGKDVLYGGLVLLMTLPILLVASGIVNKLSGVEYTHPVIDAMKEFPWLIGILAWQAVIVAPISEEFFFRSVLIGWFESIHFGRSFPSFWNGWTSPLRSPLVPTGEAADRPEGFRGQVESSDPSNPYRVEMAVGDSRPSSHVGESTRQLDAEYNPPWWPVLLSASLFGLAHFSYGVSWIPLILFGIVLGRVYQYRQSLITCIAIHMLFNGINLLNLWLAMGLPKS